MKRTIVMIRHAKTLPAGLLQNDYSRLLSEKGDRDAPAMGSRLLQQKLQPALIIASPAKRAAQTATHIATATGYDSSRIQWEASLYNGAPAVFESVISRAPDAADTLFIVAHNPGITDFVNQLSPVFRLDNIPTCGMVAAYVSADSWQSFPTAKKEVFLFDYPKPHT